MSSLKNLFNKIINANKYKRKIILLNIDILIILLSIFLSFSINYETFFISQIDNYKWFIFTFTLLNILMYIFTGHYKGILKYQGEKTLILGSYKNILSTLLVYIFGRLNNLSIPSFTILFLVTLLVSVISLTTKVIFKDIILKIEKDKVKKQKIIIYGAGSAGAQLAESIQLSGKFNIEAFIDDDPQKWGRNLNKVIIIPPNDLEKINIKIDKILLAIPSLNKNRKREILQYVQSKNYSILEIPTIEEITTGKAKIDNLQPIDINDLLGREASTPDNFLLKDCTFNKVICVTGGGGSIGSELCKEIIKNNPKKLVIIDKDEFNLYRIEQYFILNNHKAEIIYYLEDVNNIASLDAIIKSNNIEIIYHVAAYKHVPLVERNPLAGIRNNVLTTNAICQSSLKNKVQKVLLISTDKAVRPTNIMGASKRLAEIIVQCYSQLEANKFNEPKVCFSFVRFGNVLGSSGSVIPLFKRQIMRGGPITLTHKDVNRYFMTIKEAAQLIIQASSLSKGGEVFLLDMGEPIKIKSLAEKMIRLSGLKVKERNKDDGDIEIVVSGLRSGEKLYEELLIDGEAEKTIHPLIYKSNEPLVDPYNLLSAISKLKEFVEINNSQKSLEVLKTYVPEWDNSK